MIDVLDDPDPNSFLQVSLPELLRDMEQHRIGHRGIGQKKQQLDALGPDCKNGGIEVGLR